MKQLQRPLFRAAAAAVSVCALTLGGAALPAFAEEPALDAEAVSLSAVDKYELAAAQVDSSVEALKQAEKAGELGVTEGGGVFFIDPATDAAVLDGAELTRAVAAAAAVPGSPAAGSLPGAPVTIYLDFDGAVVADTAWNQEQGDGPMTFTSAAAADAAFQKVVWASVAEDYAPFKVNVTTTNPGDDAIYKTSAGDNQYGVHMVITDSYTDVLDVAANSGGIAYVGATGDQYHAPAFVFTAGTGNNAKSVAEAASHEAGHNFGLSHDGIGAEEYYHATAGIWGPIMGASYVAPLTQWSNGDYANSTTTQNDVAIITDRAAASKSTNGDLVYSDGSVYTGGFLCGYNGSNPATPNIDDQFQIPNAQNMCDGTGAIVSFKLFYSDRSDYRADTVGNTTATAAALDNSTGSFTASNVIINRDDVDVYSFTTDGGAFSATVEVADVLANLDSSLTLSNSAGAEIQKNSPTTSVAGGVAVGLNSAITIANLAQGTYYLTVDGVGQGDNQAVTPDEANGYSDYGSLGNYKLSGNAPAFVVDPIVITSPADGATVSLGANTVAGTAEAGASVSITIGGASYGPVTASGTGAWTTPITTVPGNNVIVATQTVGGTVVSVTDTVTVTVPVDAPVITGPANDASLDSVTFLGTGTPGAVLTVTFTVAGGTAQTGTATVASDGHWAVVPATALAAGEYTATATQAINGVTSAASASVAFSITGNGGGTAGGEGTAGGAGTAGGNGTAAAGGNGNLPNTGSSNSLAGLGFGAIALLLIGAGVTVVAVRQRKLSVEG